MADFCAQTSWAVFGSDAAEGDFVCSDPKCPARSDKNLAHWHLCEGCGYAPHDCAGRCLGTAKGCSHPEYGCRAAEASARQDAGTAVDVARDERTP